MNDGLLAIKRLKGEGRKGVYDEIDVDHDLDTVEYYLQALDIVKEKNVDIGAIKNCVNAYAYNDFKELTETHLIKREKLTELEFSHLKEVFDND